LFCVWHDSAVIAAFGGRHSRTAALTSHHRDGLFVASVVKCAGVSSVRGSTGASGFRALRDLLHVARAKDIVITSDGPRGPRRTVSRGIVYLSSKTGNGIVPTAFACSRCWRIKGSWTDLVVPRPFSRVVLMAGTPIYVPPNLSAAQMSQFVVQLQSAMDHLDTLATLAVTNAR
jgi:lysophospholipid acyltransferase (LPLAT)-like uncharacterized protein